MVEFVMKFRLIYSIVKIYCLIFVNNSTRSLYRLLVINGLINMIQKYHKEPNLKHSKYVQLTVFSPLSFELPHSFHSSIYEKIKYDKKKKKKREPNIRKSSHSKNDRNLNFTRERSSLEKPPFMDHAPFSFQFLLSLLIVLLCRSCRQFGSSSRNCPKPT